MIDRNRETAQLLKGAKWNAAGLQTGSRDGEKILLVRENNFLDFNFTIAVQALGVY